MLYKEDPKVGKSEDNGSAGQVNAQDPNARGGGGAGCAGSKGWGRWRILAVVSVVSGKGLFGIKREGGT